LLALQPSRLRWKPSFAVYCSASVRQQFLPQRTYSDLRRGRRDGNIRVSEAFSSLTNQWYRETLNSVKVTRIWIVDNFATNLSVPHFLRYQRVPIRFLYLSLCLLFFVGLLAGAASAADAPGTHAASPGPNLSFSVADFDGDSKPDLASVEYGTSDSAGTDYLIQLRLSAVGRQSFQIAAPIGGLQIVARDVNGDHALDLVITTRWHRQPVAILLNDGH